MSHLHDDPEALAAFRKDCREHLVFYGFICDAMPSFRNFVEDLMTRHSLRMTDPYRVGVGTPASGFYPASLSLGDVLEKSDRHGEFGNRLAKLTFVAIYALWEDHYRLIHPLILLSNDTKDSLECPLLHKHLQKPLHQWTDSLIRPVGNMVIQHQPLTKQRVRTIFHRVRL